MFAHTATASPAASREQASTPTQVRAKAASVLSRFAPRLVNGQWAKSRRPVLRKLATLLAEHEAPLASALSQEGRRPISACEAEVRRAVQTVQKTEDALLRLAEPRALDFSDALQGGRSAQTARFTVGPLFAIAPFNFPINLALHKVAPAVALGLPFVCKGPVQNFDTMRQLAALLEKAGVPSEDFLLLQADGEETETLLAEVPFPLVSFTGSKGVGLKLRQRFWDRRVILELGSTAAAMLCDDVPRWELERISQGFARSAFGQAGQSCISLQHLILEPENAADFVSYLKDAAAKLAEHRNPSDPATVCSSLVNAGALGKVKERIEDARAHGAAVWMAGEIREDENYAPPTLVLLPPGPPKPELRLLREEVFGPVLVVHKVPQAGVDALAKALLRVDANIHASIHTYDTAKVKALFERSACHALLWNETPSWRADDMPYGGTIAAAGLGATNLGANPSAHTGLVGSEGPLYSMMEYTWERLLVLP